MKVLNHLMTWYIIYSGVFKAFHLYCLFGVYIYLLFITFEVETNVLKAESDGSEKSAKFQSLSLVEPNLTGFLGQEVGKFRL